MENMEFLDDLNASQRVAVEYIEGPSLVIAGAGSGKTRVLTYKIAFLLKMGIKPWEIMALTFTNKAAREMKERVGTLVGTSAKYLVMGTFHSVFSRILRTESAALGFSNNFTIYDDADSKSLCKSIIKEMGLDDKVYKANDICNRISAAKNHLIASENYSDRRALLERDAADKVPAVSAIYKIYSERCRLSNALDFDDLLLYTYILFRNNEDIRKKYADLFKFVLVDEYQDTNYAQQQIIFQLTSENKKVCVVGDDAQSIYAFRGANIDNILDFQEQYGGASLFKLEQNYRSTQNIVDVANSLIQKNKRQIHKEVFSKNAVGDKVSITGLSSDREEAMYVCNDIRARVKYNGNAYSDFAILYRTNSQSHTFEEQILKSGIPYIVYGGLSFYQRKEIKDFIAYLRLVCNSADEEALKRIINYPARGLGATTINKVVDAARMNGVGMWEVLCRPDNHGLQVNKGTLGKLVAFRRLVEGFSARKETDDALTLVTDIVKESGMSSDIYSSSDPEYVSKQEHLEEFLSSVQEFVETAREEGSPCRLEDYLRDVALLTDYDNSDDDSEKVTLMTVHSSKGLEFPCVYVVGMEENVFPSPRCTESARMLEEERRLLYVAITRAEKVCKLTYAKMRYRYGKMEFSAPSRFLRDLDCSLVTFNRPSMAGSGGSSAGFAKSCAKSSMESAGNIQQMPPRYSPIPNGRVPVSTFSANTSRTQPSPSAFGFQVGDKVSHDRFGNGVITSLTGEGDSQKATVEFCNAGVKQLLLKFARLKKRK